MVENTRYSPTSLVIKSLTWDKDSVGLFDFESKQLRKASHIVTRTASLVTDDDEVFVQSNDVVPGQTRFLLNVETTDSDYYVVPNQEEKQPYTVEKLWYVVNCKAKRVNEYRLSEGDIIRLGRAELRVKELSAAAKGASNPADGALPSSSIRYGGLNPNKKHFSRDTPGKASICEPSAEPNPCRVCYSEEFSAEDPLISICKCDGSLKFVHIKCLQTWINIRASVRKTMFSSTYEWRHLECELCKTPYPALVQINEEIHELVSLPKKNKKYLVLEELNHGETSGMLVCHYINLDAVTVSIGRSHTSDIRVNDISVSRVHASIKARKDGVYLTDSNSKFGTLIEVCRPIIVTPNSQVTLQAGKSVFTLSLKKQSSFWNCIGWCNPAVLPAAN